MNNDRSVLETKRPSFESVEYYLNEWENKPNYVAQEIALDKLFLELCSTNSDINDILIKCSTLNDFYSTNIFRIYQVALHFIALDIDRLLTEENKEFVNKMADVVVDGVHRNYYSFATKYCSHHRPEVYPIYDSFVDKVLKYYRDNDNFYSFADADMKIYPKFCDIIDAFKKFYKLEQYSVKQIDKYLWLLGKDAFPKKYKKSV